MEELQWTVENFKDKPAALTIKGKFTWRMLGRVLGRSVYPRGFENYQADICGLAKGKISYKIYNDHKDFSLGEQFGGSTRSAHVCLHSDGVCFSPSLRVQCDFDFTKELYDKVLAVVPKE
jgi:hypothetical protein